MKHLVYLILGKTPVGPLYRPRKFGKTMGSMLVGLLLVQSLVLPLAHAQDVERTGTSDLVTGAACFVLTPVYGAFKLAFAGAGAIVGGLTWAFTGGDQEAAQRVWDTSLKGTYIITPDHLEGKKAVRFIGQRT